jgi:hypothetical protein
MLCLVLRCVKRERRTARSRARRAKARPLPSSENDWQAAARRAASMAPAPIALAVVEQVCETRLQTDDDPIARLEIDRVEPGLERFDQARRGRRTKAPGVVRRRARDLAPSTAGDPPVGRRRSGRARARRRVTSGLRTPHSATARARHRPPLTKAMAGRDR